jgi:hypothetical protein
MRNSVMLRLRRLRQPRYLVIGLGLAIYFGSVTLSRSQSPLRIPDNYEQMARIATALLIFGAMAASWMFGANAALQFTLAEVNFLFPAPVARRTLLKYKIGRLLVPIGGVAVFLTLVLGPARPLAAAVFALKTITVLWVTALFEAGTSLYRLRAKASDGARARIRLPILAAAVALLALGSWTLAVFLFADGMQILRVLPVVLLLIAACVVWILSSDAAFEEEAAINADKVREVMARVEKGRPASKVRRRGTGFRLAPTGRVELAILWKNWLLFGRPSRPAIIGVVVLAIVFVAGFSVAGPREPLLEIAPFLLLVFAGAVAAMGPMMMRSDLRRDLANLVVLKTWPVSGAAIVRGELLAPGIALSLLCLAALVPAMLFVPARLAPVGDTILARLVFLFAVAPVTSASIFAQLVIQNAIAVTFPAWIRPRVGGAGGVENMGTAMVTMYGGILALLLAALLPAAVAAAVMFILGGILLPALVFSALLMLESFAATEIVGRILDRTDLQDVG